MDVLFLIFVTEILSLLGFMWFSDWNRSRTDLQVAPWKIVSKNPVIWR